MKSRSDYLVNDLLSSIKTTKEQGLNTVYQSLPQDLVINQRQYAGSLLETVVNKIQAMGYVVQPQCSPMRSDFICASLFYQDIYISW